MPHETGVGESRQRRRAALRVLARLGLPLIVAVGLGLASLLPGVVLQVRVRSEWEARVGHAPLRERADTAAPLAADLRAALAAVGLEYRRFGDTEGWSPSADLKAAAVATRSPGQDAERPPLALSSYLGDREAALDRLVAQLAGRVEPVSLPRPTSRDPRSWNGPGDVVEILVARARLRLSEGSVGAAEADLAAAWALQGFMLPDLFVELRCLRPESDAWIARVERAIADLDRRGLLESAAAARLRSWQRRPCRGLGLPRAVGWACLPVDLVAGALEARRLLPAWREVEQAPCEGWVAGVLPFDGLPLREAVLTDLVLKEGDSLLERAETFDPSPCRGASLSVSPAAGGAARLELRTSSGESSSWSPCR